MASFKKIKPDHLFSNVLPPQDDQLLIVDQQGKILQIDQVSNHDPASIQYLSGALVPGFVNAHCHLELSHMKGKVETGTGLIKFIEGVVSMRHVDPGEIEAAIVQADQEMLSEGIVAVGDICNQTDTFRCKNASPIYYHSFVEMFDFWQDNLAQTFFDQYQAVYKAITDSPGHKKSAVPHAPYSVSRSLFKLINQLNRSFTSVSMHNQETRPENQMFESKLGPFIPMFEKMGFSFDHFQPTSRSSIHYALENLDPQQRILFVHNTLTGLDEIEAAQKWCKHCYWVSCPNANLYIENRLPNYQLFIAANAKVCLGTDSLTSNWQLSILEEMKTIAKYQSSITLEQLVTWATKHGAEALGIEDRYGTIEVNKTPGLNLITLTPSGQLAPDSTVERIA